MSQIVSAKIQHLEDLITICRQSFLDAYEKDSNPLDMNKYLEKAFNEASLYQQLTDDQCVFYLYQQENQYVAYAKLRWDRPHSHFSTSKAIELERLYVLKTHWGQQIGSILLNHCISYAQTKGYEWLWLLVWHANKRAISFYEDKGFSFFGTKIFEFGNQKEVDWLYKKQLV